jgi:hypothetical protein
VGGAEPVCEGELGGEHNEDNGEGEWGRTHELADLRWA